MIAALAEYVLAILVTFTIGVTIAWLSWTWMQR